MNLFLLDKANTIYFRNFRNLLQNDYYLSLTLSESTRKSL